MTDPTLQQSYQHCQELARRHYENFPVASYLLPRKFRMPVSVIYAFARTADDIADEGNLQDQERLDGLEQMQQKLHACVQGEAHDPIFIALADVIRTYRLPVTLFEDLLNAFRMDVTQKRYLDFGELMFYCRHSANPVGRLLLHLYGEATPRNVGYSDAICSALQLINFLQDLQQDYHEMQRIYLPQDEMQRFGVTEDMIANGESTSAVRKLLLFQLARCQRLLQSGAPLGLALKGRIGLELRMIILGGSRILEKLQKQENDLFTRPRLGARDWPAILINALFARFRVYWKRTKR